MRIYIPLILAIVVAFAVSCTQKVVETEDVTAVKALASRIIPDYAASFVFQKTQDSLDCFEVESVGKKIVIRGNNANSMAVGLNWYLKNCCKTTVSWYRSDPVQMPSVLPKTFAGCSAAPEGESPCAQDSPGTGKVKMRVEAKVGERFFLNYCTFGYTMPWWKWEDWERFIDWMALNGVTMPLAITGQEAVWQKVWRKHGLTDEQIRSYFTGPAHLPWHRMTNIDKWEGPLPQEWIDSQAELQKRILARERELGMTPVLPAFAGHVPQELSTIYPDAQITRVSYWGGFADEYRCSFLAPMDSLFAVIQKDFITEQTEMFGSDHIYGADPFNEIDSPSWDPQTLARMSSHIYSSLADADPEAVWLQMGWLFYADPIHWTKENVKAFLEAVPRGKLIMLDYYCEFTQIWEQTESFYSQPYIWCYLGNFGGNTMLSGNFRTVSERIEETFRSGGDNLFGLGSTLEGFGVNQWMYEFVLDKAWDTGMDDEDWLDALADRRIGEKSPAARKAWHLLADSIYVEHSYTGHATLTCAHPCLEGNWHWTTKPSTKYSTDNLYRAWNLLLESPSDRDTYLFDLVNLGRQYLGDIFIRVRDDFTRAYRSGDAQALDTAAEKMLEIIRDMETLVACHPTFSLNRWIEDARAFGNTDMEKDYYEKNARTLISVWGDSYSLSDYASRAWSGMLSSYYGKRWEVFISEVKTAMAGGKEFDAKSFDERIWAFEQAWTSPDYPIEYPAAGDALKTARILSEKYASYVTIN